MPLRPSTEKYTNGRPRVCFWLLANKEKTRIAELFVIVGFDFTLEGVNGAHSLKRSVSVFYENFFGYERIRIS